MKIINTILAKKIFLIGFFLYSITGFSQQFTVSLANGSNPTPTTFEVDIVLTVIAPVAGIRLSSVTTGVNYNPTILNGGTPCTTAGCGSWAYVGGKSPAIAALLTTNNTNRAAPVGHLRTVMPNLTAATAIDIPPGVYTVGRYRFTNTVPFATNSNANLWLQPNNSTPLGSTNTIVSFYPFGQINPLEAYTTTAPGGSGLILPNTQTTPFSLPLNRCFTSGTFTQTPVTCFGGNNGTATITMAPSPSNPAITYTIDAGAPITGTLVADAFTVSGLTAGPHTIVVTGANCTTPVTVNIIVGGPAGPLTNGSVTTSICSGGSYVWPLPEGTGLTYTTAQTNLTNTVGCNTATLNLTINSSSTYYVDADNDGYGSTTTASLCSATATAGYAANNTDCDDNAYSLTNTCSSIVNLKLNIQGYYDAATHAMRSVMANQGIGSSTTDVDDVTVELRDSSTSGIVASVTARLHTDGTASAIFVTAPIGSFYIAVKHRNSLETWSSAPQTVGSTPLTYDFTTAANKAYGDNMIQLESGVYGLYSGDLNQDEAVDIFDFPLLFNDNDNFSSGYLSTDLNGDGAVDIFDFPLLLNNNDNFIYSSHP